MLAERNDEIFVIPDILCNAGGVVVSYFEWVQDLQQFFWAKDEVMDRLERALDRSWSQVVERAPPRRRRQPHRGDGDRRRAGEQGQAGEGPVSVTGGADHAFRRQTLVRDAEAADMAAVQGIYAHYVLTSLATFEETPPTLEEMLSRRQARSIWACPISSLKRERKFVGFAYASAYHRRAAYRFAIEDSVYVADGLGGRGIGAALLGEVIARCERGPWRQMLAIVGDSANAGSIALHRRFGFELAGTLRSVGFKFGQWVDTPILQRTLGPGGSRPAAADLP